MENEERIPVKVKQTWQTPDIIDLDVDKTESGSWGHSVERTYSYS